MITHGSSGRKAKRTKKEGEEEVLHFSLLKKMKKRGLRIFKPPLQEHYQAAADICCFCLRHLRKFVRVLLCSVRNRLIFY
jgi:hypothetical protein